MNTIRLEFLKELRLSKDTESQQDAFGGKGPESWLEERLAEFEVEKVCGAELTKHLRKKLHHLVGLSKFEHYF